MTDKDYKFHMDHGFRIIRINQKLRRIELKKQGKESGWSIMDRSSNLDFLKRRLDTYLQDEKTIQDF